MKSRRPQIVIMTVKEACIKFSDFMRSTSISDEIRHKLLQVPVILCEIEYLQKCDPSLAELRDRKDKISNELCVNLMAWIEMREIHDIRHPQSGEKLSTLLYVIALTLANLNPVNAIDFATRDPILPEYRIVTSDRYQHDIDSLQQWLKRKNTNPWTNLKFSRLDINFIKLNLQLRKPDEAVDINEDNIYPDGDPALQATLDLAQSLEQAESSQAAPETIGHYTRRLFRRNSSTIEFRIGEQDDLTYNQLVAQVWSFYGVPATEHRLEYAGIPVSRIPSYDQVVDPFSWPTSISQQEGPVEDLQLDDPIENFKLKLCTLVVNLESWNILRSLEYVKNEIFAAYHACPSEIQAIHDRHTEKMIGNQPMNFFAYLPDTRAIRSERETWRSMFPAAQQHSTRMREILHLYTQQLRAVIADIQSYEQRHNTDEFPSLRIID